MITPLTFSQTVTKTTSRGHTLLQGKICIQDIVSFENTLETFCFGILPSECCFCNAKHSNMSWKRLEWHCQYWWKSISQLSLTSDKTDQNHRDKFGLGCNYICLISIVTLVRCWVHLCAYRVILNDLQQDSCGLTARWFWVWTPVQPGNFCLESACSPNYYVGFLQVLRLSPAVQRHGTWFNWQL